MWKAILSWWYGDPFKYRFDFKRVGEIATLRKKAGLKRFPNLSDHNYLNSIQDHCSKCNAPIYGGDALSSGYGGTKCADCMEPTSF